MDPAAFVAIELNDAGIVLARAGADGRAGLLGPASPGFAVVQDGRVYVGLEAARRHRLVPLNSQTRFWHGLGTDPLPWNVRGAATAADLAHAHLSSLLEPAVRADATSALVAVPPGWSRAQLGLLVGIANESGVTVHGLVDLGLAACSTVVPAPHLLHLDLQLHQASATLLETARGEGLLRRARYELLPGVGVLAFRQALAAVVATAFVRETRFDPLHQAATEQRLHDRIPEWLAALAEREETEAAIEFGADTHRTILRRDELTQAVERLGAELMRLVQASRPAGLALNLCLTPRVAAIPGLAARLASLRDCVVVELAEGAAALGALESAAAIARAPDALALVHRLPLAVATGADSGAPVAAGFDRVPGEAVPTHVLFRGRAWPLTDEPLTLGWAVGPGTRALSLPPGSAGVSRTHCILRRDGSQAVVEDRSTYGTFVNDERVGGQLALRVGDVLRLGAPGVTLELIRVLESP